MEWRPTIPCLDWQKTLGRKRRNSPGNQAKCCDKTRIFCPTSANASALTRQLSVCGCGRLVGVWCDAHLDWQISPWDALIIMIWHWGQWTRKRRQKRKTLYWPIWRVTFSKGKTKYLSFKSVRPLLLKRVTKIWLRPSERNWFSPVIARTLINWWTRISSDVR